MAPEVKCHLQNYTQKVGLYPHILQSLLQSLVYRLMYILYMDPNLFPLICIMVWEWSNSGMKQKSQYIWIAWKFKLTFICFSPLPLKMWKKKNDPLLWGQTLISHIADALQNSFSFISSQWKENGMWSKRTPPPRREEPKNTDVRECVYKAYGSPQRMVPLSMQCERCTVRFPSSVRPMNTLALSAQKATG